MYTLISKPPTASKKERKKKGGRGWITDKNHTGKMKQPKETGSLWRNTKEIRAEGRGGE